MGRSRWVRNSETLTFAAGNAKALAHFNRRQADLAVSRTDAKAPRAGAPGARPCDTHCSCSLTISWSGYFIA
jgi:hypothetical protein